MRTGSTFQRTARRRSQVNPSRLLLLACAALLISVLSGCASLGPCALYGCPTVETRAGDEWGCGEIAIAVNRDTQSHTFGVSSVAEDPDAPAGLHRVVSRGGPYTLEAGGEMTLGCTGSGQAWIDYFVYEIPSAQASPPPR